jgi:pyruvate/2-oxoacid:ferredoxin oxidoreductase beta subunit
MLSSKELATAVTAAGERFVEALSECLTIAKSSSTPEEYERLKRAVGSVVGTLEIDLLWPLYREHPDLEPENLRKWKDET